MRFTTNVLLLVGLTAAFSNAQFPGEEGGGDLDLESLMEKLFGNLRYYKQKKQVNKFSKMCRKPLTNFASCLAGEEKPKDQQGKNMIDSVDREMGYIMEHPEGETLTAIGEATNQCFIDNDCTEPEVAIECFITNILQGSPWNSVKSCLKNRHKFSEKSLKLPNLGDLDVLKSRLRFFASLGLYKKYFTDSTSGRTKFWGKWENGIRAVCPSNKVSTVKNCINGIMSQSGNQGLILNLKEMAGHEDEEFSEPILQAVLSGVVNSQMLNDLSPFGEPADLEFLMGLFMKSLMGCGIDMLKVTGKSRTGKKVALCFNYAKLTNEGDCGHVFNVPRCFHFAFTLVRGICDCRNTMTSSGADPFSQTSSFLTSGQSDFISDIAGYNCANEENKKDGFKNCQECQNWGEDLADSGVSLADGFEEEIEIIMGFLKSMCDRTTRLAPFKKTCDPNSFTNSNIASMYRKAMRRGSKGYKAVIPKIIAELGNPKQCPVTSATSSNRDRAREAADRFDNLSG